jgi:hypothetical protein
MDGSFEMKFQRPHPGTSMPHQGPSTPSPLITCHVYDGALFLEHYHRSYDLIIVDAFNGDTVPAHLVSGEFFQMALHRLKDSGTILVNILLEHDLDRGADDIAGAMTAIGLGVQVLDTPGELDRNAIVIGSEATPLERPKLHIAPEADQEVRITAQLGRMRFRARRTPLPATRIIDILIKHIPPH